MTQKRKILVLGAGVSGLSTALALVRKGHDVTVWSKEPAGTSVISLAAYAMWVPVNFDSDDRILRWANATRAELERLAKDPAAGIVLRSVFVLKEHQSEPWYANVAGFRHGKPGEYSPEYADAHVVEQSPIIDPAKYLPYLVNEIATAGGAFQVRELASFADVPAEFDAVVNCTGLGARKLTGDTALTPERVQVVKVKANGFDKVVIGDEGPHARACVVPHGDYIKLGGVFDGAVESLEIDDALTADIIRRCNAMVPGLNVRIEDVIEAQRGHRPERPPTWLPRVEADTLPDGRTLFHNYGHDGMGYLLSTAIAADIAEAL